MKVWPRLIWSLAAAAFLGGAAMAEPLYQDGKSRLYKRILLRNDVPQRPQPNAAADGPVADALKAYYVFEERDVDGQQWLRLSPTVTGKADFWALQAGTTPWRQAIVLKFTTLGSVDRLLFFRDDDAVYDVIESEDPSYDADLLRRDAEEAIRSGEVPSGDLVALGPETGVDLQNNFYVLPILDAEEAVFETGGFVNVLKVAVAKSGKAQRKAKRTSRSRKEALKDFTMGVVFAVDTTRSMGRYFDPVRRSVARIYDRLSRIDGGDGLRFGLVGFRDAKVKSELEYRTQTFANLAPASAGDEFFAGLDAMREATASTKGFNEDSFAGVKHALDSSDIEWTDVDAKFVIMITDAGPRLSNDPLSTTKLSAAGLAGYARDNKGAHVISIHLKTPKGARTHAFAEDQYRTLSNPNGADPLYFPVEASTPAELPEELTSVTSLVADALAQAIEDARAGLEIEVENYDVGEDATEEEADFTRRALRVAKSMQLDYLGAETSADAPDVFEGWIADRDFQRQGVRPVEIRLLVNRRQLSDLAESLELIVEKAEESTLDPKNFFSNILGAAAEMARRPDNVASGAADGSLADAALISELLEGLPYRSQVMSIDEAAWLRMSILEQTEFQDLIYEKLERYRQSMAGVDNWVLLDEAQEQNEAVFPMPLENLP